MFIFVHPGINLSTSLLSTFLYFLLNFSQVFPVGSSAPEDAPKRIMWQLSKASPRSTVRKVLKIVPVDIQSSDWWQHFYLFFIIFTLLLFAFFLLRSFITDNRGTFLLQLSTNDVFISVKASITVSYNTAGSDVSRCPRLVSIFIEELRISTSYQRPLPPINWILISTRWKHWHRFCCRWCGEWRWCQSRPLRSSPGANLKTVSWKRGGGVRDFFFIEVNDNTSDPPRRQNLKWWWWWRQRKVM